MNGDILLNILDEWLEEWEMPSLIPRDTSAISPEKLKRILAIVGLRRSGKTSFMYQLIDSILQTGRYTKKDILFLDYGF
jgi:predicted AAA+ superfamily ATPase